MRKSFLIGIFLLWLVLAGLATAFVAVKGVDLRIVAAAGALCVFPVFTTLAAAQGGADWPRGRRAMLVSLPWILMSCVFIAATGGMESPALVFVVFPPLFALAFGWKKLAVETSVFSLIALLFAVIASNAVTDMPGARSLAEASQMYALAGLCMLPFLVAGFVRQDHFDRGGGDANRSHRVEESATPPTPQPAPADGPAAGLDPIDAANDTDADAMVDVTREGRIRSLSGAVPPGLSLQVGRVFVEGFPADVRGAVEAGLKQGGQFRQPLSDGRTLSFSVDRHEAGTRIFLSEDAAAAPMPAPETGEGLEDALKRAEAAEAALADRTAFFAGLSHDLKTPLNAVLGFADLMKSELRGPMPEAYRDYAALIHDSGQDLLLTVEDILDYARTEAGQAQLDSEPVDLVASAESVMAQLSGQAERAGIQLTMLAKGEVWAQGDPRAVRQIWQNLLSNALKYSEPDSTITLDARAGGKAVALSVRDTGAGMDEQDLKRIAQPFQQGRNARGRAGTGLGLAVVRSFAELMNGKVAIDTALGEGTRVRVVLPKADPAEVSSVDDAAQ